MGIFPGNFVWENSTASDEFWAHRGGKDFWGKHFGLGETCYWRPLTRYTSYVCLFVRIDLPDLSQSVPFTECAECRHTIVPMCRLNWRRAGAATACSNRLAVSSLCTLLGWATVASGQHTCSVECRLCFSVSDVSAIQPVERRDRELRQRGVRQGALPWCLRLLSMHVQPPDDDVIVGDQWHRYAHHVTPACARLGLFCWINNLNCYTPCLKKLCIFVSLRTSTNFHQL